MHSYYSGTSQLNEQAHAYPGTNFRYMFMQKHPATIEEVNFNNATTWHMQEAGREDAKAAIAAGPGTGF
jgi:hypothetical protein